MGLGIRSVTLLELAAVIGASVALLAQAPDRARTEALARRASDRLQALQREADRLATEEQTLLGDLRKLEIQRQIKAEEFRDADGQVQEVSADLVIATDRMNHLERRDLEERPALAARLVEMYKLGQGRYLRLLLSTADLRHVGEASRTIAVLAELDRQRIAEHQRTLSDLRTTRAQLETRREELARLRTDAQRARAAVERAEQAKNDLVRDIDRRRDLNAELAGELESVQHNLQLALRNLANGTSASETPTLPLRPFRGDLPWPVDGAVRRRFGVTAGARALSSNGIEIAAADGARVEAIHDGVVAFADTFAGFGNLVILDHGAQAYSLYGNLLGVAVRRGVRVDRGEALGTVGPSALGPAGLYFELRIDGQPADPLQWLKKR